MVAAHVSAPKLPLDMRYAIAALSQRFDVCHLISLQDIREELPRRDVSRAEIDGLMTSLADRGIRLIDANAADLLAD